MDPKVFCLPLIHIKDKLYETYTITYQILCFQNDFNILMLCCFTFWHASYLNTRINENEILISLPSPFSIAHFAFMNAFHEM